jgi:hypothetical protein
VRRGQGAYGDAERGLSDRPWSRRLRPEFLSDRGRQRDRRWPRENLEPSLPEQGTERESGTTGGDVRCVTCRHARQRQCQHHREHEKPHRSSTVPSRGRRVLCYRPRGSLTPSSAGTGPTGSTPTRYTARPRADRCSVPSAPLHPCALASFARAALPAATAPPSPRAIAPCSGSIAAAPWSPSPANASPLPVRRFLRHLEQAQPAGDVLLLPRQAIAEVSVPALGRRDVVNRTRPLGRLRRRRLPGWLRRRHTKSVPEHGFSSKLRRGGDRSSSDVGAALYPAAGAGTPCGF